MIIEVLARHKNGTPKAEEVVLVFTEEARTHEITMDRKAANELRKKLGEALFQTA